MGEKYAFLELVTARMAELCAEGGRAVVGGDVNITHRSVDLKNWKGNLKAAGCLPEERAYLDTWFDEHGWVDLGRRLGGEGPGPYPWWSWRWKAFDTRLPAPRPPGVRAGTLAAEPSTEIHPAVLVEPGVQVGALLRQATRSLEVPLPVLQVDAPVRDVHIPADDGAPALRAQLGHPSGDQLQEGVLLPHRRGVDRAGVDVGGHDRQGAAVRQLEVRLDPPAGVGRHSLVQADPDGADG